MIKKLFLLVAVFLLSTSAIAQIKIIVPFAPGGAFDVMARNFAHYIENTTKESAVVENVTGAGSILGTQRLLSSSNKNVIMVTSSSYFMNIIQGHFSEKDFKVASILGETPSILLGSKTKNLTCADLRNTEKTFFIGTAGKNSASSSAASLIIKRRPNFIEVPYKGISAAMVDVLGDRIDFTITTGNSHTRPDTNNIANTTSKKFDNIISWKECLGIRESFIVEYVVVANANADLDFVGKINKLAFMFAKDQNTTLLFKERGITDTTGTLEDTDKRSKESLSEWKKVYQEK
jgi:tripartite-type tricarboxylate transporter receptor subunit TctC